MPEPFRVATTTEAGQLMPTPPRRYFEALVSIHRQDPSAEQSLVASMLRVLSAGHLKRLLDVCKTLTRHWYYWAC